MDDYSFLQDLLVTWRSTTDWVKAVVVLAIPGYAALFTWLVLSHRADMRAVEKIEAGSLLSDDRIRELTRAEMCRIAAEWERARKARAQKLTGDTGRGAEAAVRVSTRRP